MRPLTAFFVLLVGFMTLGSLAHAQGTEPVSKDGAATPVAATKEEVNQLRSEVAAQRQTIEELKALVEKLAEGKTKATVNDSAVPVRPVAESSSASNSTQPVDAPSASTPRLTNAVLLEATPEPVYQYSCMVPLPATGVYFRTGSDRPAGRPGFAKRQNGEKRH